MQTNVEVTTADKFLESLRSVFNAYQHLGHIHNILYNKSSYKKTNTLQFSIEVRALSVNATSPLMQFLKPLIDMNLIKKEENTSEQSDLLQVLIEINKLDDTHAFAKLNPFCKHEISKFKENRIMSFREYYNHNIALPSHSEITKLYLPRSEEHYHASQAPSTNNLKPKHVVINGPKLSDNNTTTPEEKRSDTRLNVAAESNVAPKPTVPSGPNGTVDNDSKLSDSYSTTPKSAKVTENRHTIFQASKKEKKRANSKYMKQLKQQYETADMSGNAISSTINNKSL